MQGLKKLLLDRHNVLADSENTTPVKGETPPRMTETTPERTKIPSGIEETLPETWSGFDSRDDGDCLRDGAETYSGTVNTPPGAVDATPAPPP